MVDIKRKILIQGIEGSYHHLAVNEYFKEEHVEIVPCHTFREQFLKLASQPENLGLVAMENTLAGSLLANYTLLRKSGLMILGEHKMRICHCLLALPGQSMNQIAEVHSHAMALAQCEDFLFQYPAIQLVESEDTALSAKQIRDQKAKSKAAIASHLAAQIYDLEILKSGIETNPHNFTRFQLIGLSSKAASKYQPNKYQINKSSLVFSLPHEAGSLARILSVLSFYGINLTKIQSLPVLGREWEYLFYIDLTFDNYERYRQSLDAIRPLSIGLQNLGEYQTFESRTQITHETKHTA